MHLECSFTCGWERQDLMTGFGNNSRADQTAPGSIITSLKFMVTITTLMERITNAVGYQFFIYIYFILVWLKLTYV